MQTDKINEKKDFFPVGIAKSVSHFITTANNDIS
jgi:uncharacterized radical SAM superfamily Fe-S cluster-containing enzyme